MKVQDRDSFHILYSLNNCKHHRNNFTLNTYTNIVIVLIYCFKSFKPDRYFIQVSVTFCVLHQRKFKMFIIKVLNTAVWKTSTYVYCSLWEKSIVSILGRSMVCTFLNKYCDMLKFKLWKIIRCHNSGTFQIWSGMDLIVPILGIIYTTSYLT